ncbi:MAG: hypothetical protein U9N04_03395 [Patescibacteria group bacterium]|nr:hypothetical protein [Patescibacteria group bacterium]
MKAFEENIGMASNPLSSPHENDPFNIPKDPLKETIDKFVTRKKETTGQHNENFTEKDAMELVRNEVNDIEVDLENPAAAVEEIIQCLLEQENIEISEDIKKYIEFAVSEKTNFLRNLKRLEIDRDNPNREEKKLLREMALEDAEWIGDVVEYIRENRDNPKEIENFWEEYDKTFLSFKEHKNNKNFTEKYNIEQGPEVVKRGILAEIAAMDLLEKMANGFEECEKDEIEYSTPEEDVHKKIDFFLVMTFKNRRIKKIPVQVTSCDLSTPINNPLNEKKKTGLDKKREREGLDRKIEFVLRNTIHTGVTAEDIEINPNYNYQKRIEDKMKKFFDENESGVFVFVPYGEVIEDKIDSIKGEHARKKCVHENGKPSGMLKNHFSKSSTIKSIETNLAQIVQ